MRGRGLKQVLPMPYPTVESRLLRGRGLKRLVDLIFCSTVPASPPMRGRGLKPFITHSLRDLAESPPMRGRGLKPCAMYGDILRRHVAPYAGAWIETPSIGEYGGGALGRPLCGGVD